MNGFLKLYLYCFFSLSVLTSNTKNMIWHTIKPERFRGQHAVGWVMIVLSFVFMGGAVILGAWDGISKHFGFRQFFQRFVIMLIGLNGVFDWVLLCNAGFNFFPRFYPETRPVLGHCLFGYNRKTYLLHLLAGIPVCALLAWVCTIF